ncbi:MAG: hypothetical protein J6X02_03885 [Bacilli bacterium]|nr:hypothetical protein [Bacilli bacterium]
MNEELRPMDNNQENNEIKIDFNQELTSMEEEKEKEVNKFIEGFPDWDLLPPNQVVRRVTRK